MTSKVVAIICGIVAGFVIAWARLSDPGIIRDMLLLRDTHVFLVMGSAIGVAAMGVHLLRGIKARALVTREPIEWRLERPQPRHVGGSLLFAVGWSVAGTCPGPVAAMVGQGRLGGLVVMAGLLAGVTLQRAWSTR